VLSKDLFMIQYREKNLPLSISCEHVLKLVNKAQKVGVKVIINDRVDLCAAMDADGVHIGKEDLPVGYCRKLLGIKKYIGFTTHSVEELVKASKDPQIDYVSFGTIFASQTKTSRPFYGEQILSKLKDLKLVEPPILIGGINEKNVDIVIKYGFKRIAVSAGIFSVENPRRAVERILNKLYK
jgi:thiamine-phosphate pyrophosphorylase